MKDWMSIAVTSGVSESISADSGMNHGRDGEYEERR